MNRESEQQAQAPSTAAEWFARLDDAPSAGDRQDFAEWLDQDPEHEDAYRRLETRWVELGLAEADPRVARLKAETAARAGRHGLGPSRRAVLALAASLVLVLGMGVGGWLFATRPATYATGQGERLSLTLADHSQVDLAPRSRLLVRLDGRERRLELKSGQAYFQVAHESRPFRVRAADRVVTALGTQFQVRVQGRQARVLLVEGAVSVASLHVETARPPVRLKPNESLSGPLERARPVRSDVEVETAWRSGRLIFRERPLAEVVEEFNRWSPTRLEIGDPAVADMPVSGSFRQDGVEDFLTALQVGFNLRVDRRPDGRRVISGAG